MSVTIQSVEKGSPAALAGIRGGETLVSINRNSIIDVLDYRFYQNECELALEIANSDGLVHETERELIERLKLEIDA